MAQHKCKARGCERAISTSLLMCGPHWRAVPRHLQLAVWKHYKDGQERTGKFTKDYLVAARSAIMAVAIAEGKLTREEAIEEFNTYKRFIGYGGPIEDSPSIVEGSHEEGSKL